MVVDISGLSLDVYLIFLFFSAKKFVFSEGLGLKFRF